MMTSMSIALSATLRPAWGTRLLLAAHALGALAAALLLADAARAPAASFVLAWPGAWASLFCALLFGRLFVLSLGASGKPGRLDISAVGQIRLTVYQAMGRAGATDPGTGLAAPGVPVRLLPGSTLWPHFLLLRLQTETGLVFNLPVWQGSVAAGMFRPLSVACRSIAIRTSVDP